MKNKLCNCMKCQWNDIQNALFDRAIYHVELKKTWNEPFFIICSIFRYFRVYLLINSIFSWWSGSFSSVRLALKYGSPTAHLCSWWEREALIDQRQVWCIGDYNTELLYAWLLYFLKDRRNVYDILKIDEQRLYCIIIKWCSNSSISCQIPSYLLTVSSNLQYFISFKWGVDCEMSLWGT